MSPCNQRPDRGVIAMTLPVYVCPMCPEVRNEGPGVCPSCGMALEPETVTLEEQEDNPELADMRRRFVIGLILTVPLFRDRHGWHAARL